MPRHSVSF